MRGGGLPFHAVRAAGPSGWGHMETAQGCWSAPALWVWGDEDGGRQETCRQHCYLTPLLVGHELSSRTPGFKSHPTFCS
jgi:hypothetical protein